MWCTYDLLADSDRKALDIKLNNILIKYGQNPVRFSDVKVADCGDTTHISSEQAKNGAIIGASVFRSPEAMLNMAWNTATDIWSFGTLVSYSEASKVVDIPSLTFCTIADQSHMG